MNRAVPLTLLFCMATCIAAPAAIAVQLNYTLYVLAVPAADATLSLDLGTSTYRVTLRFHTTGIANLFVSDRLDEHSAGRVEAGRPAPIDYVSNGRLHGQDRLVSMIWRDGTPEITAIVPRNAAEREDVPTALLAHVMDPLDAIVLLLRQVATTGRCEGSSRAFDGRRLQALESITVGQEDIPQTSRSSFSGHALRCDFTDHTLAGFRIGSGRSDDLRDHHGSIWLARIFPDSPVVPVRASVQTRWLGDATIYLTSATP